MAGLSIATRDFVYQKQFLINLYCQHLFWLIEAPNPTDGIRFNRKPGHLSGSNECAPTFGPGGRWEEVVEDTIAYN
jgi:hypothetical protein